MNPLTTLDIAVCAALCLRVLFYRRCGTVHRPLAAVLAWIIIVASGAVAMFGAFGNLPEPLPADIALHLVLCLAAFASRGNVAELFHTSEAENCIYRLIRRTPHAQG